MIKLASSEHRNKTALAISSGRPHRFSGVWRDFNIKVRLTMRYLFGMVVILFERFRLKFELKSFVQKISEFSMAVVFKFRLLLLT